MKKIISIIPIMSLFLLLLLIIANPVDAKATTIKEYKFGDNVKGVLDENHHLTVSGTGPMYDFAYKPESATATNPLSPAYNDNTIYSIDIQNGVTYIGYNAFSNCKYLKTVNIDGSVKKIGADAFIWDRYLREVTLGEGVETIGSFSFGRCDNLETVTLPSTLKAIEFEGFYGDFELKDIILPEGLEEIGGGAFGGCVLITDFNIPSTVKELGSDIFGACRNIMDDRKFALNNINVSSENPYYKSIDGVVYTKNGDTLVWYPDGRTSTSYSVLDGTKELGDYAINNEYIKQLILPNTVIKIGDAAIAYCENLETINIPDDVNTIGNSAFYGCKKIKSFNIPKNVKSIGYRAFAWCLSLEDIYFNCTDLWMNLYGTIDGDKSPYFIFYNCKDTLKVHLYKNSSVDEYMEKFETKIKRYYDLYTTVFLDSNGGTLENNTTRVIAGETYGNLPIPKNGDRDFLGWFTMKNGGDKILSSSVVEDYRDHTLYAHWEKVSYKIKFDSNGGTGKVGLQSMNYGKASKLKLNKFSKKGYTFVGWATSKANAKKLKVKYTDKQKVKNLSEKNGSTVTLYAVWVKNNQVFKVTYKLNGKGAKNNKSNKTKYTVTSKTFKLKVPNRKGYKFVGWYTKKSGGKKVTKISKGSYGNKTLYARWIKI